MDRLEPVGNEVPDELLTVLFCALSEEDELLPAAEESCVPWVVEEFALEEGTRVFTGLAAAVLRSRSAACCRH